MSERVDLLFLGPSLPHDEARAIYPEAVCLPPAAMGDLISAVRRFRPHAVGLVDGSFLQSMATYHKEILEVMASGVWVVGGASMGALRAAECSEFGMIGVGEIYDGYASGKIEDDDEVALSHVSAEFDFRPVTDAMVDIRACLALAAADGVLTAQEAEMLCDQQKQRWFMERHLMNSCIDAANVLGFSEDRTAALETFSRENRISVKANDAAAVIRAVSALPDGPMPVESRPRRPYSPVFSATVARDVVVGADDGQPVTLDQIRRLFSLSEERSFEVWRDVRRRCALHRLMAGSGVKLTDEDYREASEAIAEDLGVQPEDLLSECASLDMTEEQVDQWIEEEAYLRRAEAWSKGHAMYSLFTTEFLNALRRSGEYRSLKTAAGFQESVARSSAHLHTGLGLQSALTQYESITGWSAPEDLDSYLDELELGPRAEFYERVMTGLAVERTMRDLPLLEVSEQDSSHKIEPKTSRGG